MRPPGFTVNCRGMLAFAAMSLLLTVSSQTSAQSLPPLPPPPGTEASTPAAPAAPAGEAGDDQGGEDYFDSDAAKDDTPAESKTIATPKSNFAVDCSVPPKNMTKVGGSCFDSPTNNDTLRDIAAGHASKKAQIERIAMKDEETSPNLKADLAKLAKMQIVSVLKKINDFLATYCNNGYAPITTSDIDQYVTADKITLVASQKWVGGMNSIFPSPGWKTTMGFYDSTSDTVIASQDAKNGDTVVLGHEFLHRIFWLNYHLNFGWHHAFIEGSPGKGFLGWGVDNPTMAPDVCTLLGDCKGLLRCWNNWHWTGGEQLGASTLASQNPGPLQYSEAQMTASARDRADRVKKKKEDDKLDKEIQAQFGGMMDSNKASLAQPSSVDAALKRSEEPPPDLSEAYKQASDPKNFAPEPLTMPPPPPPPFSDD